MWMRSELNSGMSDVSSWQDWLVVWGYIGFAALITWRVLMTPPK
jgi:hypothetical protein